MEQKTLSLWLKVIIFGVGVCLLVVYLFVIPMCGTAIVGQNPELHVRFWPWLIFIWGTALPIFAALVMAWRIAANIGHDRSFSNENARLLKHISILAVIDSAYFFVGNLALLLCNMSHPGVTLFSFVAVFAGIAMAVAAAALSRLVKKAAVLQEQSDLTI